MVGELTTLLLQKIDDEASMAYRLGDLVFSDWRSISMSGGRCTDTFIVDVSAFAGLSPYDYAEGVKVLIPEMLRLRRSASIWVRVDSPGFWYPIQLQKALHGARVPVAVTRTTARTVGLVDFSFMPWMSRSISPAPPVIDDFRPDLDQNSIRVLRVMAKIMMGFRAEISSLAGLSATVTWECLKKLSQQKCVYFVDPKNTKVDDEQTLYSTDVPFWKITKKGTGIALRSWGIPPGYRFTARREKRRFVGDRHRRVSRLWPAWLTKNIFYGEIWTGWSEIFIPELRMSPDSLAWGMLDGRETLLWLEVDSGHQSSARVIEGMRRKFFAASRYVEERGMRLVFAVLGRPWVINVAKTAFSGMEEHTAVVLSDWKAFARLPIIQWGTVRMMEHERPSRL